MNNQINETKPLNVVGNNVVKVIGAYSNGVQLLNNKYKQMDKVYKFSNHWLSEFEFDKEIIIEGDDVTNFKYIVKYLTRKGYKVNGYHLGGFIMERD